MQIKECDFFMRAANGMGTVSKLSGKRRKPWLLRDNKRFNEETGKFERLALGVFETKKEAETYRIAYFTNNLDMIKDTGIKIHKKKEKGITYLFICHDLALVHLFCHNVVVMYKGEVVERLNGDALEQAQHPYTKQLLSAVYNLER